MTAQPVKDAYEQVVEPVDSVAVIVTGARGGDKAGCLVTFSGPCSIDPPVTSKRGWVGPGTHERSAGRGQDLS